MRSRNDLRGYQPRVENMKKHVPHTRPGYATACETELADYVDSLVSYMRQYHERGYGDLLWDLFKEDRPSVAAELEEWMKLRYEVDTEIPTIPPGDE